MKCKFVLWKYIYALISVLNLGVFCNVYRYSKVPKFLDTGQNNNVTVHMGQRAELKCKVENVGTREVVWKRDEDPFPLTIGTEVFMPDLKHISVQHIKHSKTIKSWNLIIENAQPSDSGIYECQVTTVGQVTYDMYLTVLDYPLVVDPGIKILGKKEEKYVNLYDPLRLVCNSTGATGPPDTIDWFFDGEVIDTRRIHFKGRIEIPRYIQGYSLISELIINRTIMSDQGRYICRSSDYDEEHMPTTSIEVNILNTNKNQTKRNGEENKSLLLSTNTGSRNTSTGSKASRLSAVYYFFISVILYLLYLENG